MMWEEQTVNGRKCHILKLGGCNKCFVYPFFFHRGNELEHLEEVLMEESAIDDCMIIACEVSDWNGELSPWQGISIDGSMMLGRGAGLLEWIEGSLLSWMNEQGLRCTEIYIMGYSLAGLFAMWSLYETALFDGAVCCSSSFWYEKWDEYAAGHLLKQSGKVYLSLGGKEEKSDNALMASVGDRTRQMERLLKADANVKKCILEMNSGGHFADSEKRLVKGIRWMCGDSEAQSSRKKVI